MTDPQPTDHEKEPRQLTEAALQLARALVWPFTLALLLICFWSPLHRLVDTITVLLPQTEEFSIGGASFHLRKSLVENAPPEVKAMVQDRSAEEIRIILEVRPDDVVCYPTTPSEVQQKPYRALVKLGLLAWATPEQVKEQEAQHYPCGFGVTTTPQFKSTREFLITAITESIEQSKTWPELGPATINGDSIR